MRGILAVLFMLGLFPSLLHAQFTGQRINVLSYYAVSNAIDGQPLIDRKNVLRFYPVFALKDSVTSVRVIVYHGNEVDVANSVKFLDGHYWESKLPDFDIGEAIQRYEVEVDFKYSLNFRNQLEDLQAEIVSKTKNASKLFVDLENKIQSNKLPEHIDEIQRSIDKVNIRIRDVYSRLGDLSEELSSIDPNASKCCNELSRVVADIASDKALLEKSIRMLNNPDSVPLGMTSITDVQARLMDRLSTYSCCLPASISFTQFATSLDDISKGLKDVREYQIQIQPVMTSIENVRTGFLAAVSQRELGQLITSQQTLTDTIKSKLIRELTDPRFTGKGIQKSDIIFHSDYSGFKLLYRNYRVENRAQVALDPAEKLSIFRLRYVPFPVIGSRLEGPTRKNTPVVFEIGVNFGNEVISTNEFAKPELSLKRLGVAVAVTPKLFNEDASILALALTYEFNAYASIGAGWNFGTLNGNTSRQPYFSFGINQKAFQRLVTGVANVFK